MEMNKKHSPFPYKEVYPLDLVTLIEELESKLGYAVDYTAATFLVAFGAAIGNTTHIGFKKSFIENASLYCILVGKPARGKSAPLHYCLRNIFKRNNELYNSYLEEVEEYKELEAKKKAGEEVEMIKEPGLKVNVLNDTTLETLLQCMQKQPRGLLVVNDEIKGLIANFNRYNKGSDAETFLSIWSHTPISVTRKTSGHFQVNQPFCSIIGGTQPDVLKSILGKAENGFSDRWLLVPLFDNEIAEWNDFEINEDLEEKVASAFEKLFALPELVGLDDCLIPNVLELTPEARSTLISWRNDLHRQQLLANEHETYVTAHSKMDIMVLRFALILEMIYFAFGEGNGTVVDTRAVNGAIRLVDYFKRQVEITHQLIFENDVRLLMSNEQADLYVALPNKEFKTSEAVQIASTFNQSEWQVKRFLKKEKFFEKKSYGMWKKILVEE